MEDAALVGVVHGAGQRDQQFGGAAGIVQVAVGNETGKTAAFEQPHAEVLDAVVLTDFIERHDVGVVQVGGGLRLDAEPLDEFGRGQAAGQDHLEGDKTVQTDLPGLVDHAHGAAGDFLDQFVIAEIAQGGAGGRRSHGLPEQALGTQAGRGVMLQRLAALRALLFGIHCGVLLSGWA